MIAHHKLRLAVLISGRGSNMEAIARACAQQTIEAQIERVIADRSDAAGIAIAQNMGLAGVVIDRADYQNRDQHELAVCDAIDSCDAGLVALAGYMRILSPGFVQRYAGRLLNIHPSLLPAYKGLHTHRRVLENGEREHGSSVHYVSAQLDAGPVICQARVSVMPGDTEDTLAARVLKGEHKIYPLAIGLIASGRVRLGGDRVLLDDRPLLSPLSGDDPLLRIAPSHA